MDIEKMPLEVELKITDVESNKVINVKESLRSDLYVRDWLELNAHLNECSAKYLYWATLRVLADKELQHKKLELDKWVAEKKRDVMNGDGGKLLKSEKAKEESVLLGNVEEYAQKNKAVIDAEYNLHLLEVVEKAWLLKKDMLITLGTNYREEVKGDLIILQKSKDDFFSNPIQK